MKFILNLIIIYLMYCKFLKKKDLKNFKITNYNYL